MLRSMVNASNTMNELQKQMNIIGHNMSNIDTAGYKSKNTSFSELMRQELEQVQEENNQVTENRLTPEGLRLGTGAVLNERLFQAQGSLKESGRKLDFALTKPYQFFQVNAEGETRYTRDGAFYLSVVQNDPETVQLVNKSGHPVLDAQGSPISFNRSYKELNVNENGGLTVVPQDAGVTEQFDLGVATVTKPQALKEEGGNLFSIDPAEGDAFINLNGAGREVSIKQGALEMSNVDQMEEMTDLMTSQRSYEMNARAVTLGDQMLGLINGVR
ncbi:flagellar hook-basal body protein [Bacillus gobiensis]|uniref:flagellar hook-basal body protein n=1 Tax=Bacillus gobiensis TaxID=1441095 RepID=UPI003D20C04B